MTSCSQTDRRCRACRAATTPGSLYAARRCRRCWVATTSLADSPTNCDARHSGRFLVSPGASIAIIRRAFRRPRSISALLMPAFALSAGAFAPAAGALTATVAGATTSNFVPFNDFFADGLSRLYRIGALPLDLPGAPAAQATYPFLLQGSGFSIRSTRNTASWSIPVTSTARSRERTRRAACRASASLPRWAG